MNQVFIEKVTGKLNLVIESCRAGKRSFRFVNCNTEQGMKMLLASGVNVFIEVGSDRGSCMLCVK